jgi:hypothetical protein
MTGNLSDDATARIGNKLREAMRARDDRAMRRLQLAAEAGQALAFVYRAPDRLAQPSSAALRVALRPAGAALRIEIVKVRRGQPSSVTLELPWSLPAT